MFVAKCGGIKLNEDVFKEINGVITLSTESEVHDPVTSCGQLWDSYISIFNFAYAKNIRIP